MFAVGFGQDFACTDVEQEAGKEAEVERKYAARQMKQHGRQSTKYWCESVKQQEAKGSLRVVFVEQHEIDRIQPISKVVSNDSNRYGDADARAGLEAQTNTYTIQEAVTSQRERRRHPNMRMMVDVIILLLAMVDEYALLDNVKCQESTDKCDHRPGSGLVQLTEKFEYLGHYVKGHNTQEDASSVAEQAVQPVLILKPGYASE